MPRNPVNEKIRLQRRLEPEQKSNFILQTALREATAVIKEADSIPPSERDSLLMLDLLENPPQANAKLSAAMAAMPQN